MDLNATTILGRNHDLRLLGHEDIGSGRQRTQVRVVLSFGVVLVDGEVDFKRAKNRHGVPRLLD
jgi:hypothetical protein